MNGRLGEKDTPKAACDLPCRQAVQDHSWLLASVLTRFVHHRCRSLHYFVENEAETAYSAYDSVRENRNIRSSLLHNT
jgi:hypothetical protein